jgi:4-hydroxy-tetrahydrodipicolinate reductase
MEHPLRIAISGYGKMGREIEKLATEAGHQVVAIIDSPGDWQRLQQEIKQAEVVIEFTTPSTATDNIERCFQMGIPVVCGTTGWYDNLERLKEKCLQMQGALLYSSNFSPGVNVFFEINRKLAQIMSSFDQYKASIREVHHKQKLDAPSGTAVTLARDILDIHPALSSWVLVQNDKPGEDQLPVEAFREDFVTGTHTVTYTSMIDSIEITHTAFNRQGFVQGALMAASWIRGKKGIFTMRDLLKF